MTGPKNPRRPPAYLYIRYKIGTDVVTTWIDKMYRQIGPTVNQQTRKRVMKSRELETCGDALIARNIHMPPDIHETLGLVIRLREHARQWYMRRCPEEEQKNEGHRHFNKLLEKLFRGLKPSETETAPKTEHISGNRYQVLSNDDETTLEDDIEALGELVDDGRTDEATQVELNGDPFMLLWCLVHALSDCTLECWDVWRRCQDGEYTLETALLSVNSASRVMMNLVKDFRKVGSSINNAKKVVRRFGADPDPKKSKIRWVIDVDSPTLDELAVLLQLRGFQDCSNMIQILDLLHKGYSMDPNETSPWCQSTNRAANALLEAKTIDSRLLSEDSCAATLCDPHRSGKMPIHGPYVLSAYAPVFEWFETKSAVVAQAVLKTIQTLRSSAEQAMSKFFDYESSYTMEEMTSCNSVLLSKGFKKNGARSGSVEDIAAARKLANAIRLAQDFGNIWSSPKDTRFLRSFPAAAFELLQKIAGEHHSGGVLLCLSGNAVHLAARVYGRLKAVSETGSVVVWKDMDFALKAHGPELGKRSTQEKADTWIQHSGGIYSASMRDESLRKISNQGVQAFAESMHEYTLDRSFDRAKFATQCVEFLETVLRRYRSSKYGIPHDRDGGLSKAPTTYVDAVQSIEGLCSDAPNDPVLQDIVKAAKKFVHNQGEATVSQQTELRTSFQFKTLYDPHALQESLLQSKERVDALANSRGRGFIISNGELLSSEETLSIFSELDDVFLGPENLQASTASNSRGAEAAARSEEDYKIKYFSGR